MEVAGERISIRKSLSLRSEPALLQEGFKFLRTLISQSKAGSFSDARKDISEAIEVFIDSRDLAKEDRRFSR